MQSLSVRDCLRVGWTGFKARPWIFVGTSLVIFAASIVADLPRSIVNHIAGNPSWGLGFLAFLIGTGISFLISMGKTAFYLQAHDAPQSVEITDLWHPHPYWKFVAVSVLAGAATIIGLVLLIVPGIIIGIALGFSLYIVIEKGSSPFDAMRESAALTKGNRWNLFLLGLALIGINILGFCALFVGLLVSVPVSTLAVVHAYRTLSGTGTVAVKPVTDSSEPVL